MDNATQIRDIILQNLKQELGGVVMAEIDGNYFKAADVAFPNDDSTDIYRITVLKHDNKKDFCG